MEHAPIGSIPFRSIPGFITTLSFPKVHIILSCSEDSE